MVLQIITNGTSTPEVVGKLAPLFGDGNTMLIFSAVVFGLALQTIWGYWSEKKKGNPTAQSFDSDFFYTAIGAFVAAGIPALAMMPTAAVTFNAMVGTWGLVFAWLFTAAGVFGVNRAINKGYTSITKKAETKLVESGRLDELVAQKVAEYNGAQNDKSGSLVENSNPQ